MQCQPAKIKLFSQFPTPPNPSPAPPTPFSTSLAQPFPHLRAILLPSSTKPTHMQAFHGNPYPTDNEIRREQKSKPRCSMASCSAGQTMVPAASQEAPSHNEPSSGAEEGPGSLGGRRVVTGICISLVTCQLSWAVMKYSRCRRL